MAVFHVSFPDPCLTASIHCEGGLDAAIFEAVAPFWLEFSSSHPASSYLWLMRYRKGGEHLKVRIHGPESLVPVQRRLLEQRVASFFTRRSDQIVAPRPERKVMAPAIDVEDEVEQDHPDHTFHWTTYRRSHVSLGGGPLLGDDIYAELFTRCLATGCELLLALEPGIDGLLPHRIRHGTLLKALIAGLGAMKFSTAKRSAYLAYHRDWLLRYISPRDTNAAVEPAEKLRLGFEERVTKMQEALQPVRVAAGAEWNALPVNQGPLSSWRSSLEALIKYIAPLSSDPAYSVDPYASDSIFPPLFKVFHGFANQLGLKMPDEAFAHHLLFRINCDLEKVPSHE